MLVLVMLSQMGLGTEEEFNTGTLGVTGAVTGVLYDVNGTQKLNATTLEPLNSSESITIVREQYSGIATFYNDTNLIHTYYTLYYDNGGANIVMHKDLGRANPEGQSILGIEINDQFAFLAIVSAVIVFVGIIGLQFFDTGLSETSISTIVILSVAIAFWTILSFGAIDLITSIPYLGNLFYVALTLIYGVGCYQSMTGVESE